MRVIHLLRKPLSEGSVATNVLKHGCGGLNIDATRITYQDESDMTPSVGKGDPGQLNPGCGPSFPHHKENWGQWEVNRAGRWPANLILEHLPGCRQVGVTRVRSSDRPGHDGRKVEDRGMVGQYTDHMHSPVQHGDADGMETVDVWDCEPGCPVADLDERSGPCPGAYRTNLSRVTPSERTVYSVFSDDVRGERGYPDTGGASRFFKQIGGDKD